MCADNQVNRWADGRIVEYVFLEDQAHVVLSLINIQAFISSVCISLLKWIRVQTDILTDSLQTNK